MKNPFSAVRAVLLGTSLALATHAAADDERFLFIGNSFTFRHELKDVFQALAKEGNPTRGFYTERLTYGGRDLFRHFELYKSQDLLSISTLSDEDIRNSIASIDQMAQPLTPPDFYTAYWKTVDAAAMKPWEDYEAGQAAAPTGKRPPAAANSGQWQVDRGVMRQAIAQHQNWLAQRSNYTQPWNYVSLQSWQDVSPDLETGYAKYAVLFAEVARKTNTRVILYLTAPYSQNDIPVQAPIEPARALGEVRIARALAEKTGALVVPVPLALYRLQKNGTDLTFRYRTDGHPNQCGAYLTACLFYAAVFNKSPEGLTLSQVTESKIVDPMKPDADPDGNPLTRVFTEAERTLMQRTAWETMEAFRKGDF
jgi:hypothetical protein